MSKKKKLIRAKLIANPGAGKATDATARLEQATRSLLECGIQADVALAKPKKEATPIAKKAVKDGYKIVIAMGGDGTIEAVLRGLVGSKSRLGILPAGTANNIAKSLGIPEDLSEASALIAAGHTRKLDVGQVKTKKNKKKLFFFELTAVGLTAALYPEAKDLPTRKLAALKDTAATFLKFDTKPTVFLTLDGESKVKVETMLVTVANTPVYGLNFKIAPDASLQDGLLDISVFPEFSKADVIAYYAKVMNEGDAQDGRVQRYRARKLKIKTVPKLDIMADGIMLGKGTARIKILPGALRVIAPEEEEAGLAQPPEKAGEELPAPVSPAVSKT